MLGSIRNFQGHNKLGQWQGGIHLGAALGDQPERPRRSSTYQYDLLLTASSNKKRLAFPAANPLGNTTTTTYLPVLFVPLAPVQMRVQPKRVEAIERVAACAAALSPGRSVWRAVLGGVYAGAAQSVACQMSPTVVDSKVSPSITQSGISPPSELEYAASELASGPGVTSQSASTVASILCCCC